MSVAIDRVNLALSAIDTEFKVKSSQFDTFADVEISNGSKSVFFPWRFAEGADFKLLFKEVDAQCKSFNLSGLSNMTKRAMMGNFMYSKGHINYFINKGHSISSLDGFGKKTQEEVIKWARG